jgi:putative transposase/transposase-like zinc-binding protein
VGTPATVLGALRRFIPELLKSAPALSAQQHRAIWAITHCRTPALGGRAFACKQCHHVHFAYHSCNHKACPQCGALSAHRWVQRELRKLVNAPYFLVTFTLPAQLRTCFFGPRAKQAYELFFSAASGALSQKLAADKALRAQVNGFVALLHTWTQKLEFHPHIHCLVPGAGLNEHNHFVRVKKQQFLLHLPHLQAAFRQHLYQLLKEHDWQADPQVWRKDWGVHIQPSGSGASVLKYLGAYVARTAITNARMLKVDQHSVTFRWKDRSAHNQNRQLTLPGIEFARRYLRHVLPTGLRSVRYYGFCHPTAKASRMRVQLHSGRPVQFGQANRTLLPDAADCGCPPCPRCGQPTQLIFCLGPCYPKRGPPVAQRPLATSSFAA